MSGPRARSAASCSWPRRSTPTGCRPTTATACSRCGSPSRSRPSRAGQRQRRRARASTAIETGTLRRRGADRLSDDGREQSRPGADGAARPPRVSPSSRPTTRRCTRSARSPTCLACSRRSCAVSTHTTSSGRRGPTGGQRRYSRIDIDRIDAITTLIGEGMTLAGAQRILELQAEIEDLHRQLADLRKRTPKP